MNFFRILIFRLPTSKTSSNKDFSIETRIDGIVDVFDLSDPVNSAET